MKRKITAITLLLAMILCFGACLSDFEDYEDYEDFSYSEDDQGYGYEEDSYEYGDYGEYNSGYEDLPFDSKHGSAKELDGTIAVVSIFTNDNTTGWDFNNPEDSKMFRLVYDNLTIATQYLENESKSFGHNVNFVYDWEEYPELYYELSEDIDYNYVDDDFYNIVTTMSNDIAENVPTESILEKTGASQVIYMAYFNTPTSNNITSVTHCCDGGGFTPYEICFMFMNCDGYLEPPSCFAHEMLHTFGAPDLYTEGMCGITQEYVDYVAEIGLNDIMRINEDPSTGEYIYDRITNEITDITAYYAGLSDYSETVEEWGFSPKE